MVVSGEMGKFFTNEELAKINEKIAENNRLIRELQGEIE